MKKEEKVIDLENVKFSKEQIVKSKLYMDHQDFLQGNLDDEKEYTLEEVNAFLKKYF